jgi:hypothetical protein
VPHKFNLKYRSRNEGIIYRFINPNIGLAYHKQILLIATKRRQLNKNPMGKSSILTAALHLLNIYNPKNRVCTGFFDRPV